MPITSAEDVSWLPPHMPRDVMEWAMHPRGPSHVGRGFVQVCGTQAYEFVCVPDGRAVEILAYVDGECTHHWRRDPMDGVWPGSYEWETVAIYGKGLVR